jgi:hypothetical protein
LDQPIRILQASREAVSGALDRLQQRAKVSVLPPVRMDEALGSDAPIPLIKVEAAARSDAPIPLVRRSMVPRAPSALPAPRSVPPAAAAEAESVGLSWRSKPPPVDLIAGVNPEQQVERESLPPPSVVARSAREALEEATTPEAVLLALRDGLAPAFSIVFAVKNASFDGRLASALVERRRAAKEISLLSHQPSVLETAVKSGFYLGPIPNTPNHRELRDALPPDSVNEIYVTVVTVSDRPSLVWLIAGFEQSLDLTRRADEIALVAGRALGRILRDRKRGS